MKWGHCWDFCLLAPRLLVVLLLLFSSSLPWTLCQEDGSSSQRAILEIVLYNPVEHGGYVTQSYKLIGMFSVAGTSISAEGRIIQLHPLGLCNTNDYDELYEYGWVGVVKLERPEFEPEPCLSVFGKAKRAVQRGATAVVFDITDNPVAADALLETDDRLSRPIIVMQGADAAKLMGIVNLQSEARIRIIYSPQESSQESVEISHKEYFGMGIFVAVFLLFCLICIFVMLKLKWRHRDRQISHSNLAKRAIAKLETRKYESSCRRQQRLHVHSSAMSVHSSISECCAICLEGYKEGQVLRVMPCYHEFHRLCVDPWLENHGTCPLCKIHIADQMDDIELNDNGDDQEILHGAAGSAIEATSDARSQSQISECQGATSSAYHQHQQQHHQQQSHQSCSSSRYSLFSASGVGSHRSFISMPFTSPHSEYTPLHLVQSGPAPQYIHTCPSCRGTLGSEPSSTNSNTGARSDQALPPNKTKGERQELFHPSDYVNRRTYVREYTDPRRESSGASFVTFQPPPRPFLHSSNSHTTQVFHATAADSPVSMPCSCSIQAARSTAVYAHHAARLYIPLDCPSQLSSSSSSSNQQNPVSTTTITNNDNNDNSNSINNNVNSASTLSMELLEENQDVRASSATAVHGSFSSEGTASWECDNCRGLSDSSATGAECSNKSTYGSSDNKDSSDVSSFDSNIYRGKGSSSSSDEREGFCTHVSSSKDCDNIDTLLKLPTSKKQPLFPQAVNISHRKSKNLLLNDDFVFHTKKRPLSRRDSSSSPCLSDISAGAWSWDSSSAFVSSPVSRSKEEPNPCEKESEDKDLVLKDCIDDKNLEGAGEALASHHLTNETTKRSRSASSRPSRLSHQRPHRALSTPAVACSDDTIVREPSPVIEKKTRKDSSVTKPLKKHPKSSSVFSRRNSPHVSRKDLNRFVDEKCHKNNIAFCNYNDHNYVKSSIREKKITEGGARSKTYIPESRASQYKISGEAQSAMKDLRKASLIHSKTNLKGSGESGRRKSSSRPPGPATSCSWAVANSHAPNFHLIRQCNVCRRQHVIISSQPPALLQSVEAGTTSPSSSGGGPLAAQVGAARPMSSTLVCQVCHRSTQVPQSGAAKKITRRSMVLFTEPQGAFITIPLLEKEQFDPVNGV